MVCINNLPEELLLKVLETLSRNELLEYCMICKDFARVGLTLALADGRVLHVHPSAEAMSRLLAICEDPVFAAAVHEIIILIAQETNPGDEQARECPRQARHLLSVPWPQSVASNYASDVPVAHSYSSLLKQPISFHEAYSAMLQGLRKLPNLKLLGADCLSRPAALN